MLTLHGHQQHRWMSSRLFRKHLLAIVLLVLGALVISGGLSVFFSYRAEIDNISNRLRAQGTSTTSRVDLYLRNVEDHVLGSAGRVYPGGVTGLQERRLEYGGLLGRVPAFNEIIYLDALGTEELRVNRSGFDAPRLRSEAQTLELFRGAKSGETYYGPVYVGPGSVNHMTIAVAEQGGGNGVLVAELSLEPVQLIVSQVALGENGRAYVIDSSGIVIAHPAESLVVKRTDFSEFTQVAQALRANAIVPSANSQNRVTVHDSPIGGTVLTTGFPINSSGWLLFVEEPRRTAFAALMSPLLIHVALLIGGLSVALFAGSVLGRRLVGPIWDLKSKVSNFGREGFENTAVAKTGDDLEELGDAFNNMSQRLRASYTRLERQLEQAFANLASSKADLARETAARGRVEQNAFMLRRALDHSPNGVLIANNAAAIEYVNPRFVEMTGYSRADLMGKNTKSIAVGDTTKNPFARIWETINAHGQHRGESLIQSANGADYWSEEAVVPITNETGEPTHYLAVEQDITKTKQAEERADQANRHLAEINRTLEQRVTERTEELQQANDRLIEAHDQLVRNEKLAAIGQLSAGMAHDLRNPLGAIRNANFYLTGKLVNSQVANDHPKVIEFLKIIDDEVGNSNKIITDLMDFARIAPPTFSATDLRQVVEDLVNGLEIPNNVRLESNCGTEFGLVQIQADAQQLHRVLLNLVINALDAMPQGGVLALSIRKSSDFADLVVSDTGEGIGEDAFNRIFDPLFTPKTQGTGLGLAVCQQIATRHGGVIDVTSTKGEGSTFTVRLPIDPTWPPNKEK